MCIQKRNHTKEKQKPTRSHHPYNKFWENIQVFSASWNIIRIRAMWISSELPFKRSGTLTEFISSQLVHLSCTYISQYYTAEY